MCGFRASTIIVFWPVLGSARMTTLGATSNPISPSALTARCASGSAGTEDQMVLHILAGISSPSSAFNVAVMPISVRTPKPYCAKVFRVRSLPHRTRCEGWSTTRWSYHFHSCPTGTATTCLSEYRRPQTGLVDSRWPEVESISDCRPHPVRHTCRPRSGPRCCRPVHSVLAPG